MMSKKKSLITVLVMAFCMMIPTAAFAAPPATPATTDIAAVVDSYQNSDSLNNNSTNINQKTDNDLKLINDQKWINASTNIKDSGNTTTMLNDQKWVDASKLDVNLKYAETNIDNSNNNGQLVQDSDNAFALGVKDITLNLTNTTAYSNNNDSYHYSYSDVGNTDYSNVANKYDINATIDTNLNSNNPTTTNLTNVGNDQSTVTKDIDVTKTNVDLKDILNGADIVTDSNLTGSAIGQPITTVTVPAVVIPPVPTGGTQR